MANNIPPIEVGMMLCRMPNGALTRGPVGVGTATGVQFPDTCPPGTTIEGSVHTHPKEGGGSILPSTQDIREAGRIQMKKLCIINNDKTACYSVRGVDQMAVAAQRGSLSSIAVILRRFTGR